MTDCDWNETAAVLESWQGKQHLEEACCLQLEHKLVMHLVGGLVLAEAGPLIKEDHHLLTQPWWVRLIPQRWPQPATQPHT